MRSFLGVPSAQTAQLTIRCSNAFYTCINCFLFKTFLFNRKNRKMYSLFSLNKNVTKFFKYFTQSEKQCSKNCGEGNYLKHCLTEKSSCFGKYDDENKQTDFGPIIEYFRKKNFFHAIKIRSWSETKIRLRGKLNSGHAQTSNLSVLDKMFG